jgi:hypothetical protein
MSIAKTKQSLSNLRVKAILASYIIIVGEDTNKNKDIIVYVSDRNLFEKIVLGEDYELDKENIYELESMQKINNYAQRRIDKILNIIDSDLTVYNEIKEQYLNLIKKFIITKVVHKQIENDMNIILDETISKIIQKESPTIFIRLYLYLAGPWDLMNALNIKKEEEIDKAYLVLLKSYEILRELNPDERKKVNEIVFRLKNVLESPDKIDLKINKEILGLIKIPIQIRELKEEKNKLESDLSIIEEKLETKRVLETEPGELKNDPEAIELIEKKREIGKRLKEIEDKIEELKREWERLRLGKEN